MVCIYDKCPHTFIKQLSGQACALPHQKIINAKEYYAAK